MSFARELEEIAKVKVAGDQVRRFGEAHSRYRKIQDMCRSQAAYGKFYLTLTEIVTEELEKVLKDNGFIVRRINELSTEIWWGPVSHPVPLSKPEPAFQQYLDWAKKNNVFVMRHDDER